MPIGRLAPYHGDIVERAAADGMPGAVVYGMDVEAGLRG
jgi:hypothetical protein